MSLKSIIQSDADRCVMCGMCLPHCPTFNLHGIESESPRGRIALMQAFASGAIEQDESLLSHLDNCLGCSACESMCPSHVEYRRLRNNTAQLLAEKNVSKTRPLVSRLSHFLLEGNSSPAQAARTLLGHYRHSRIRRWIKNSGLVSHGSPAQLDSLLPDDNRFPTLPDFSPTQGERRGSVALFNGCSADLLEPATAWAAIQLLNHYGFDVNIPPGQACCGAFAQDRGDAKAADSLREKNLAAFNSHDADAIIHFNSGCGATLQGYDEGDAFKAYTADISDFLTRYEWPVNTEWEPLTERVILHTPCTMKNVLKVADAPFNLLQKIPGIDLVKLDGNGQCCGAAGDYMLRHPDTATSLRSPKLDTIAESGATIMVSSNAGCARHLAAGAMERGIHLEVMHPIVLLARQLKK